jgi:hypothetical protein
MAEKHEPSGTQILHGTVSESSDFLANLLICLVPAYSLRPATALHTAISIVIAECSKPADSSNAVVL